MFTAIAVFLFAAGVACLAVAWFLLAASKEEGESTGELSPLIDKLENEHRRFMDAVSRLKPNLDRQLTVLFQRTEQLEAQLRELQGRIESGGTVAADGAQADLPPQDLLALSERYQEIFSLHRDGKSVEQIAKTLGMGNGEVQLILQLASLGEKTG
ncbi:hypothetical protein BSNK01_20800 [Bacillaceae bacterium]